MSLSRASFAAASAADALAAAITADPTKEVVMNAMRTEPSGDGPEATKARLTDGLVNVGKLFGIGPLQPATLMRPRLRPTLLQLTRWTPCPTSQG